MVKPLVLRCYYDSTNDKTYTKIKNYEHLQYHLFFGKTFVVLDLTLKYRSIERKEAHLHSRRVVILYALISILLFYEPVVETENSEYSKYFFFLDLGCISMYSEHFIHKTCYCLL